MSDFRIIPDNEIDAWLTVASVESAAIIRQLRAERDEARAKLAEVEKKYRHEKHRRQDVEAELDDDGTSANTDEWSL